jgi:glycosyltransferase involved in cell wall biosynthesis
MAALARHLARRHEVTVLTSRARELPPDASEEGVRVVRVPVFFRKELAVANFPSMFAYLPSGFARGLTLGRKSAFDVINTHFVVPTGPLGHALSRTQRIPNVLSVHGGDLFDPSKASSPHRHAPMRAAVRWLLRRADAIVGQSQDTVRHVRSIYGVERPTSLIPLGIERPPHAGPARRAEFGLPENAFVLVTIGRLVARKATTQLIDILAATRIENAHLLVVGSGPDASAIQERSRALGIEDRVHLLGQASDAQKYAALQVSDVFASTSQHEGFGLVFLEAMAQGLPIVCYDRGGQTDFLATGETGHVVPLNDQERFKEALFALHADPNTRRACGARNLKGVEQFFIDTCAARYEQIFEEVVARKMHATSARKAVSSSP